MAIQGLGTQLAVTDALLKGDCFLTLLQLPLRHSLFKVTHPMFKVYGTTHNGYL